MPSPDRTFHPFPRLPAELRDAIWRACLPIRIYELDSPEVWVIYPIRDDDEVPCRLWYATAQNRSPPMLARVCKESRAVTLQVRKETATRNRSNHHQGPEGGSEGDDSDWKHLVPDRLLQRDWTDREPKLVHQNWTSGYGGSLESEYYKGKEFERAAIICVATRALQEAGGRASILVECLNIDFRWEGHWNWYVENDYADSDDDRDAQPEVREPSPSNAEFISECERLSSYLVVLQVVVIHTDLKTGAESGLFGLFGDAPVQIIDMTEDAKIDRYFSLAVECENRSPVSIAQDLKRRPLHVARQRLRDAIVAEYGSEEFAAMMKPAIMFRLCIFMCNHPDLVRKPAYSPQ